MLFITIIFEALRYMCHNSNCYYYYYLGSTDGKIHCWKTETGTKVVVLNGEHTGAVQSVQFNPKYMMLASACTNMVCNCFLFLSLAHAQCFAFGCHILPNTIVCMVSLFILIAETGHYLVGEFGWLVSWYIVGYGVVRRCNFDNNRQISKLFDRHKLMSWPVRAFR